MFAFVSFVIMSASWFLRYNPVVRVSALRHSKKIKSKIDCNTLFETKGNLIFLSMIVYGRLDADLIFHSVNITEDGIKALTKLSKGDMRRALNILQVKLLFSLPASYTKRDWIFLIRRVMRDTIWSMQTRFTAVQDRLIRAPSNASPKHCWKVISRRRIKVSSKRHVIIFSSKTKSKFADWSHYHH